MGDYSEALRALMLHPLIGDLNKTKKPAAEAIVVQDWWLLRGTFINTET